MVRLFAGLRTRLPELAGAFAASVGSAVALGWFFDVEALKRLHAAWPSMKPNTALGFVLSGLALLALAPPATGLSRRVTGRILAIALGLLGALTLAAYAGYDLHLDEVLYRELPRDLDSPAPGRMAIVTAANFLLLSFAFLTLDARVGGLRPAQNAAILGAGSCLVTLLAYLYGAPAAARFDPFVSVALHTALALSALWAGVLFARPRLGFMAELTADAAGGLLARRLLPQAVLASVLLGLVRVIAQNLGLYGWQFGVGLFASANVLMLCFFTWSAARWLNHFDAERGRAEERYRRFFEQHIAGACTTRRDGTILECNPAFAEMFGFASTDAAVGSNVLPLYSDASQRTDFIERLQAERTMRNSELDMRRLDGQSLHIVRDVVADFDNSGEVVAVRTYVRDVTEQRRIEQQLLRAQKMEAVGQLAGGVAHDFNNLLGVMGGYADLLAREVGEGMGARHIEAIRKAVERAAALTRQLLTFSRQQPVEARACDLNQAVTGVETMLRRLIGEDVRLVVAPGLGIGPVLADVGLLEQVIMNLAVNARDAMPRGGKLVIETAEVQLDETYVRTHPEGRVGSNTVLIVSDTGEGMSRETASRIFEPFYTTKPMGKGTGLGLSLVYGIVKRFGGHVSVYSEPGRGSTFRVYLPTLQGEVAAEADVPATPAAGGTETILVLEDEEPLRCVVVEMLMGAGYEVLEAGDALEALNVATRAARPPRLLLTDVILPTARGPEVAASVAKEIPGVRVLFMSGYTDRAITDESSIPPASHYLQKPFTVEALLHKVRAILDEP